MAQLANANSGRALALARRQAMSQGGKAAIKPMTNSPSVSAASATSSATATGSSGSTLAGRAASMMRRKQMSTSGKAGISTKDRTRSDMQGSTPAASAAAASAPATSAAAGSEGGCGCGCKERDSAGQQAGANNPAAGYQPRPVVRPRATVAANNGRAASLARRKAMSTRGKAGLGSSGMSAAQAARASNPELSGRELAQVLREQRSKNGANGEHKATTECSGKRRQRKNAKPAAAEDASWKVGVSETSHGQTVTGTIVGRSQTVTGDEPSTCRAITGTEYLGADIFREYCNTDLPGTPSKVHLNPTGRGNVMTGTRVGRGNKMTGNEPGTCKNVTGTEYISSDESQLYCGTRSEAGPSRVTSSATRSGKSVTGDNVGRSEKVTGDEAGAQRDLTGTQYMPAGNGQAPAKVGVSSTLRGRGITGVMVGRSAHVTGDEPGTCKNVTGDDYVGSEQYSEFCSTMPQPRDEKTGVSQTMTRKNVTGTLTGRSESVTGDEPGTCKAVTGTPYAGMEQYKEYCAPEVLAGAALRMQQQRKLAGAPLTGQQPAVGGELTGEKGVCEPVTGTPYVGADQVAAACPATPAEPGSPDFPQPTGEVDWGKFSVNAPGHAARGAELKREHVTGTVYERGEITGPFGMASGKVTGTEEARFGGGVAQQPAAEVVAPATDTQRVKSRITGEGQNAGLKITGDDWELSERVTGTEGTSAQVRNLTRSGAPMASMAPLHKQSRNEEVPQPVSRVTGSSGNTESGSLITYSGGARG